MYWQNKIISAPLMMGMIKFYASISLLAKIAADGYESAQGESAAILLDFLP
jgi:hypothetical protein